MKKTLSLLFIAITLFTGAFANPIDEKTALEIAQKFWKKNNIMGIMNNKPARYMADSAIFEKIGARDYGEFHIFNNTIGGGFVIVAADDCVEPIIAYSYDNNFSLTEMPDNIKWWLDERAAEIREAISTRKTASNETAYDWKCLSEGKHTPLRSTTVVSPLIKTKWSQRPYYNALCPIVSNGNRAPTGCVATAMAQVMKYWSYPSRGTGFHSYDAPSYGTQSANFSQTTYQWGSMPNTVSSSNNAVATLMYHCGVSVDMQYGANGSAAYILAGNNGSSFACAENALKTYFGYNSSMMQGIKKNNFSDSQWISKLKNELDNGRPIIYGGYANGGGGGHCFVCDGYDSNNKMHFNWGWGGSCDGYYSINNLTPGSGGTGSGSGSYTYNQIAIIGIKPNQSSGGTFNLAYHSNMTTSDDEYWFHDELDVYAEVINNGTATFFGYIAPGAFQLNDDEYVFLGIYGYWNYSNGLENGYYAHGTVKHDGGEPYIPGKYELYMLYTTDTGSKRTWSYINRNGYSYAKFDIIYSTKIETYSDFRIVGDNYIYSGKSTTINVDVKNNGSSTFYGRLRLSITDTDGNLLQNIQILNENNGLSPNYHYTNGNNFTGTVTVEPGLYMLSLSYQDSGSSTWYYTGASYNNNPVYVRVTSGCSVNAYCDPGAGGTITGAGNYKQGDQCTLKVTPKAGYRFVKWIDADGNFVSSSNTISFTVNDSQTYFALLNGSTGIDEETNSLKLYPNPANDRLHIEGCGINKVRIANTIGQTMIEKNINADNADIDISGLANGIYLIHIDTQNGTMTRKVAKE